MRHHTSGWVALITSFLPPVPLQGTMGGFPPTPVHSLRQRPRKSLALQKQQHLPSPRNSLRDNSVSDLPSHT